MTSTANADRWKTLGALLIQRRTALDPRYHNRGAFCEATGLKYRLVYDIEEGRRTNFGTSTLAAIEVAYQLRPSAITAFLAGGELTQDSARAPASVTVLPSSPREPLVGILTPAEKVDAMGEYENVNAQLARLQAEGISPAEARGGDLFPGDAARASSWESARAGLEPLIRAGVNLIGWDDISWATARGIRIGSQESGSRNHRRGGIRGA